MQSILHEQVDLENSSFQNFEKKILFLNGFQDANLDNESSDDFELDSVLWIEPCLPFGYSLPATGAIAKLLYPGN